jgi:hypothetical protein
MAINITFAFDNADEAIDFLAQTSGGYVPESTAHSHNPPASQDERRAAAHEPPWNDAGPSSEADPWADEATASKPARAARPNTVELFPSSGAHTVETPQGDRTWEFGKQGAPECDCGYAAANVSGKGSNGKTFHAWRCPVGFSKDHYKDKCSFSEFTK